jgi:hypothetical protein
LIPSSGTTPTAATWSSSPTGADWAGVTAAFH